MAAAVTKIVPIIAAQERALHPTTPSSPGTPRAAFAAANTAASFASAAALSVIDDAQNASAVSATLHPLSPSITTESHKTQSLSHFPFAARCPILSFPGQGPRRVRAADAPRRFDPVE